MWSMVVVVRFLYNFRSGNSVQLSLETVLHYAPLISYIMRLYNFFTRTMCSNDGFVEASSTMNDDHDEGLSAHGHTDSSWHTTSCPRHSVLASFFVACHCSLGYTEGGEKDQTKISRFSCLPRQIPRHTPMIWTMSSDSSPTLMTTRPIKYRSNPKSFNLPGLRCGSDTMLLWRSIRFWSRGSRHSSSWVGAICVDKASSSF